ncbi:hypothetical protein [Nocardia sp. NPDC057353]|uniref:hypothetical protein n=1 Tax=Nocardia sp. NPDC057353 TaxID=3346104 RepID=UPI00362C0764
MFGHGDELQTAGEVFARALPITEELAVAAEAVLAAVEAELEQTETAAELLRAQDGGRDTETAEVFRRGAVKALAADRSRWRRIVNTLRQQPEPGFDPNAGRADFRGAETGSDLRARLGSTDGERENL